MRRALASLVPVLFLFAACSDDPASSSDAGADSGTTPDATSAADSGTTPDATTSDAGDASAPLTVGTEAEPNDGTAATEVNTMVLPGTMNGKLDPANDVDIFSVAIAPGELWEWSLAPTGADLAPHLTVFDTAPSTRNPTALVAGAPGATLPLQNFVLSAGTFVAVVRDARNVPTKTGRGGPTFGYALTGKKKAIDAIPVTFPSTKSGRLGSLGAVDVYSFTTTNQKGYDVVLRAKRKASPSTLDSRISLFEVAGKRTLITNDNAGTSTDSQFGGDDPLTGLYYVVVDNEGTDGSDLSYDIEFSLRP